MITLKEILFQFTFPNHCLPLRAKCLDPSDWTDPVSPDAPCASVLWPSEPLHALLGSTLPLLSVAPPLDAPTINKKKHGFANHATMNHHYRPG